jgi:hypothetical protein
VSRFQVLYQMLVSAGASVAVLNVRLRSGKPQNTFAAPLFQERLTVLAEVSGVTDRWVGNSIAHESFPENKVVLARVELSSTLKLKSRVCASQNCAL